MLFLPSFRLRFLVQKQTVSHTTVDSHSAPFKIFCGIYYYFSSKSGTAFDDREIGYHKFKLFFQAFLVELNNVSLFSPSVLHTVLVRMFTAGGKVSTVFTISLH